MGKQRIHSWWIHTSSQPHWDKDQNSKFIGHFYKHTCGPGKVTWGGIGHCWLTAEAKTLVVEALGFFIGLIFHGDNHFGIETWPHPTSYRLQCWDDSDQTTGWEYSPIHQFSSVDQSCPTLCEPMNHSTPGLPVHHKLPEFTQSHAHQVSDAIQPSHPLSSPSPPAPNPSQHQGLFQ